MYDSIVVGGGMAGCVAARQLAERGGRKVLVLEKRGHIGGNCYDCLDEYGILIHQYGPHIFHTQMKEVYDFLSRFTTWREFRHKVVAKVGDQFIPVPFNLNTLHMVFAQDTADRLEKILVSQYGYGAKVPILELKKNADADIRKIAAYVYENIFLKYTMKQWGQSPEEISPAVTGRVPVQISHDDGYFTDPYQGVPEHGYAKLFENMLDHENIDVALQTEASDVLSFEDGKILARWSRMEDGLDLARGKRMEDGPDLARGVPFEGEVIYTGAVDELFGHKYGRLPYRSLDFRYEHYDRESYQGHSVVNYTVSEEFTRITEFKYLTGQEDAQGTTIVKEYPFAYHGKEGEIPYYAILNEENRGLYEKYQHQAERYKNLFLLGRLAEYQYYNMDAIAKKALDLTEQIIRPKESGAVRE